MAAQEALWLLAQLLVIGRLGVEQSTATGMCHVAYELIGRLGSWPSFVCILGMAAHARTKRACMHVELIPRAQRSATTHSPATRAHHGRACLAHPQGHQRCGHGPQGCAYCASDSSIAAAERSAPREVAKSRARARAHTQCRACARRHTHTVSGTRACASSAFAPRALLRAHCIGR